MGSKISSEQGEANVEKEKNEKNDDFLSKNEKLEKMEKSVKKQNVSMHQDARSFFFDTSSSYHGIKSDITSNSEEVDNRSESSVQSQNQSIEANRKQSITPQIMLKVPTTFVWKEGGEMVYVTGSFTNWKQWFLMNRNEKNHKEFSITLELPLSVHQFKFIIDNNWKCSKDYPQINDGKGNLNNEIDTTKIFVHQPQPQTNQEKIKEKLLKKVERPQKKNIINAFSDDYGNYIPKKCDLNCEAPVVPENYQHAFDINAQSLQKDFGNKKLLVFSNNNKYTFENTSYKKISTPPHVNLNLICTNVYSKKRSEVLNLSTTFRVRNKFSTFVYYKPKFTLY